MPTFADPLPGRSRLAVHLEHFATIPNPLHVRRIAHPLAEILLLVVCGTIAGRDDHDQIAAIPALPAQLAEQNGLRKGVGAKNMAVARHSALNLVRAAKDTKSVKLRRKAAG